MFVGSEKVVRGAASDVRFTTPWSRIKLKTVAVIDGGLCCGMQETKVHWLKN